MAYKVLSIDDELLVRKMITKALEGQYEVVTAHNGIEGLKLAAQERPDVIILDVEMPGMNGYEVCDRLRHSPDTAEIPVIFLSSLDNLRSRMLGYESGGSDFLVKPFDSPEIKAKISGLINMHSSNEVLKEEAQVASHAAYAAMRGSSELGLAIQFIESIFGVSTIEQIAQNFFTTMKSLDLNTNLMFVSEGQRHFYTGADIRSQCAPLEVEVMSTIYDRGERIVDFGGRTQISYPHISILIKNMPLNDMQRYGRMKDLLPVMLSASNERIKSLELELETANQSKRLAESFIQVKTRLATVGDTIEQNQEGVVRILRKVLFDLEAELPRMGLEEDQEKFIINQLDTAMHGAMDLIEGAEQSRAAFKDVFSVLAQLAEKQKELADHTKERKELEVHLGEEEENEQVTGEVELF